MYILDRCKKAIYAVLFAMLFLFSAYVFYGALNTLQYADALQSVLYGKRILIFLAGLAVLLAILYQGLFAKAADWLERHFNLSVPLLLGVMVLLQMVMVLTVCTSLRHDHLKIFDTAVALLDHRTIADTHFKYYFMKYPNNIPLCLFTHFFLAGASMLGLPAKYWMEYMKLVNLLFMNLGLLSTFSLVCRYRSKRAGIYLLLLLFTNPLWYLLGQMYYTSTISLAFSMGAVWLADIGRRQKSLWKKYVFYVLTGSLLAAGYKIRATMIVTAAALFFYTVFEIKREKMFRAAVSVLTVLFGAALVFGMYGQAEKRYAGFDPASTGYPAIHWVMMSAQGEGQYNSADDAYTGSFSTREERMEADTALLKERLRQMGPGGVLTLCKNKLRVTFSDGTDDYYALFRTMREASWMQKYINGGKSDYLAVYLHGYHVFLMGLVLLALVCRVLRGGGDYLDVFAFNICGAYLFYIVWEADQAYSVPFMLMFALWAADGLSRLETWFDKVKAGHIRMRFVLPVSGMCLAAVFVCVGCLMRRTGLPVREYTVLQDQESSQDLTLETEFTQTFRAKRPFDHVDLWVANWEGGANDSVYDLTILDESGETVAKGEITGSIAPCMEAYTVAFDKVTPDRAQTYRMQIRIKDPDCAIKTDFLYYQTGAWDVYTEGALYAPDEIEGVDLAFAVYEVL